jgi:Kef-type K+ transport system membrane component KefB
MADVDFGSLAVVAAIALVAPLALGLVPSLRIPAVVLELLLGIGVGPSGLGWVEVDGPVRVMSLLGLAFLLLLAGLELEPERWRGRLFRTALGGFVLSLAFALALAFGLEAAGLVGSPLLVAIMLSATSLGVVIPVLKDAGEASSPFGQLVIAAASIADVATIVLLSLFFSGEAGGVGSRLVLLGAFTMLVAAVALAVGGAERSLRLSRALVRLQDTTAQIRVRAAFALLGLFVVLADRLGVEAILGAFMAGAVIKLVDRDRAMTHPRFHEKLEAAGFGIFVPFFFVTSGVQLELGALFESSSSLARVPIFLAALLVVRGAPALLSSRDLGRERTAAAALLQATSLGFLVVAGRIGMDLGLLGETNGAALVAAGLLSVLLFPLGALALLRPRSAAIPAAEGLE